MKNDAQAKQRIRDRAYQIWLEQGKPDGKDQEHWLQAEAELVFGTAPPLQAGLTDGGEGPAPEEEHNAVDGGLNPDEFRR
jgi:hypothetical protein